MKVEEIDKITNEYLIGTQAKPWAFIVIDVHNLIAEIHQLQADLARLRTENEKLEKELNDNLDYTEKYVAELKNLRAVAAAAREIIKSCEINAAPLKLDYALRELEKNNTMVELSTTLLLKLQDDLARAEEEK